MTGNRRHAHQFIDHLPEMHLNALVALLETIVDPAAAALRNAAIDDEPETEREQRDVAEARHRLQNDSGRGVPHKAAMRRLRL